MITTTRTLLGSIGLFVLGGAIIAACSAGGDGTTAGAGGNGAGSSGTMTTGTGMGGSTGSFTSSSNTSTSGTGGSCAGVSSEASSEIQPADIIIAVDTSGSMDEESAEVQQNLNSFATIIANSGIDVHVVLIAGSDVCIPAPLGSGACAGADENLPGYRHVVVGVGSNDALDKILSTYPQWQPSLRPGASKTIAVVSDDNSDLSASAFTNQLLALDPPTFQGFKFDAIVSSQDPQACVFSCIGGSPGVCCPACVPLSAADGTVYKQLVQQTGGVFGDLCLQNFDPVFMDMATAVVSGSTISCEYTIPTPPNGDTIDPTKVNVIYTAGGGSPQTVGYVPGGASACGAMSGGWYYDNPQAPTKVILCPTTCSAVQGDPNGKVEVQFGCETIEAPPE